MAKLKIKGVEIVETFAEAFPMVGTRIVITAPTQKWALIAAQTTTGFATSVIACGVEAGIERLVPADETLDGRPGVAVLMFAMDTDKLQKQLRNRVGQCVLTSPGSACFAGLEGEKKLKLGSSLRFFGDGWQMSKVIGGRRFWRIPVMDGEFVCEQTTGLTKKAVGGGNLLVLGRSHRAVLAACERAVKAIGEVPDVITPVPRRHRPLRLEGWLEIQGSDRLDQRCLLPDAQGCGEHRIAPQCRGGDGDRHRRPKRAGHCRGDARRCPCRRQGRREGRHHPYHRRQLRRQSRASSFPPQGDHRVSALTLELRTGPNQRLDLSPLTPAALAGLKPKDIQALAIGTTREAVTVGDAFKLKGTDVAKLRFIGTDARCDRIGQGLTEGEIVVDGDAGAYLGSKMRGGRIAVSGSAGALAGASMRGGTIDIARNAGERAGGVAVGEAHGMRGGRLSIGGMAGALLGERMRRGLIIGRGGAGDYAAARMIAGTILLKGRVGRWAGYGLRRGSLILDKEPKELLATFGDCGTLDFNWLRILDRQLKATDGRFKVGYRARRLIGDMAVLGKGEMLILA